MKEDDSRKYKLILLFGIELIKIKLQIKLLDKCHKNIGFSNFKTYLMHNRTTINRVSEYILK